MLSYNMGIIDDSNIHANNDLQFNPIIHQDNMYVIELFDDPFFLWHVGGVCIIAELAFQIFV